jgi:hypothetical protein
MRLLPVLQPPIIEMYVGHGIMPLEIGVCVGSPRTRQRG